MFMFSQSLVLVVDSVEVFSGIMFVQGNFECIRSSLRGSGQC